MADDGKLYPVFTPAIVKEMKKLISAATVVTPNYTEACLLTDRSYDDKPVTTDALLSIAHDLTARGPKQVVITSVPSDKGTIRIACFDAKEGTYSDYKVKRIPFATCGTGDLFTSVVTGSLLQGKSLSDAVKKAASFLSYAIEYTYKDGSDYREGVQVEPALQSSGKTDFFAAPGSEGKVLRIDRPDGRRVLKFDGAFGPEGCGLP